MLRWRKNSHQPKEENFYWWNITTRKAHKVFPLTPRECNRAIFAESTHTQHHLYSTLYIQEEEEEEDVEKRPEKGSPLHLTSPFLIVSHPIFFLLYFFKGTKWKESLKIGRGKSKGRWYIGGESRFLFKFKHKHNCENRMDFGSSAARRRRRRKGGDGTKMSTGFFCWLYIFDPPYITVVKKLWYRVGVDTPPPLENSAE